MNTKFYETHFKNGILTTCLPISLTLIAFIHKDHPQSEKDETNEKEIDELPIRAIYYVPTKLAKGDFGTSFWSHNIENLYINDNEKSWIVSDIHFQISEIDNKTQWYPIPNNEKGQLAKGMVNIAGDVYAYGMVRSAFKYTGIKQWENITSRSKHPNLAADLTTTNDRFIGDRVGFSAMDGFDQNDIYAGGNKGDCWHYDGTSWKRKGLPINSDISAITCAPNGLVYISCRLGPILVGRDDNWQILDDNKQIKQSCWFKGNIYFSAVLGRIYTHNTEDNTIEEARFKSKYPKYMHHLIQGIASCEECLVIYTEVQAYAYDDKNWHEIIEIPSLSKNK